VIAGRSVLALIPARGGSKGLPGKNVMSVDGRPLLAWTVDAARRSTLVDRIVLSTDDEAIAEAGRACGCDVPFRRPDELASDTASSVDVALHALQQLPGHGWLVLLQPTSPLRTAADIDTALERCVAEGARSCVSVSEVAQSPYWMYSLGAGQRLRPLLEAPPGATRRQDLPPAYALNGAVYVVEVAEFERTRRFVGPDTLAHIMPPERSLDIDTAQDFDAFRRLVAASPHQPAAMQAPS
jgi:CMP-N,N'-diacetyllegionaminic acid synthase